MSITRGVHLKKKSITVAKMKSLLLDNIGFFLSSRHVYIDDDAILRTYSWLTNVTVSVLTRPTLTLTFLRIRLQNSI